MTARKFGKGRIELIGGNIVHQEVDAIVNAANTSLLGGGGVDGAIHRAAGPTLLAECRALPVSDDGGRCATGETRTTGAGKLKARWVIHGVGPVFDERAPERSDALLRAVHRSALAAAVERGCRSIAFPAISTGAFGFPIDRAAPIALGAAAEALADPLTSLELVRFVLFSEHDLTVFEAALEMI